MCGNWTRPIRPHSLQFGYGGFNRTRDLHEAERKCALRPGRRKNDSVEVIIEPASVDTRVEMRDNDLRSDHFFDVQKYSTMTFRSTKIESPGANRLKIAGDLTIRGVTKPVSLDVEGPTKPIDDGHGHLHMGVSASGTLNRTDFGMTGYQGVVGNEISLTIDAELVQATTAAK